MSVKPKMKKVKPVKSTDTLSHLCLNGRDLEEMPTDLDLYKNLKVLYLHNNKLSQIVKLENLKNLVHLFLQWNNITKIDSFDYLENLEKLYLGYNKIKILENLNNLKKLKELHLENQRIPENIEFSFDVPSFEGISHSLELLNVSKLNLTNISSLKVLYKLKILTASENRFAKPEDIAETLSSFPYLKKLNLCGCPARKDLHYREKITAGTFNLDYLDEKFISKRSREFIKRFEQVRFEKMLQNLARKNKPGDVIDDQQNFALNEEDNKSNSTEHKLSFDMRNKKNYEDVSFRPWNSLNFIKRTTHVKKPTSTPSTKYQKQNLYGLQGINIKTG